MCSGDKILNKTIIFKEFSFEAAHKLPFVPEGHKCGRLHGHSYRFVVTITGDIDPLTGFIIDFADIKKAVSPVLDRLDHYYLNDIPGLENPTCENLSKWMYHEINSNGLAITSIQVFETCTAGAIYGK